MKVTDKTVFIANIIINSVPALIDSIHIIENEIQIVSNKAKINKLLVYLKNHSLLQFKSLQDLFGIDLLNYSSTKIPFSLSFKRFQIIYYLLSTKYQVRILIKTNLTGMETIDSTSVIFNSASWLEREVWDLYGIFFKNHPDLRRILTDYGFEGYPLRKDFPLSGYTEILYTSELKKITTKPLELTQEYRDFDFISPWDLRK